MMQKTEVALFESFVLKHLYEIEESHDEKGD